MAFVAANDEGTAGWVGCCAVPCSDAGSVLSLGERRCGPYQPSSRWGLNCLNRRR